MYKLSSCVLAIFATLCVVQSVYGSCQSPPPSSNFTLQGYYGVWYEYGKIQTPGGAAFEKDCVCTTIDVEAKAGGQTGDSTALNSCRKLTPQGSFLNATGQLTDMSLPGKWKEGFFPLAPKVDYTVIYLDKDFAVEYDCGEVFGITNYCIHIMSRTPNPDPAEIMKLVSFSEGLGLNPEKITFHKTLQTGCW